MKKFKYI